VDLIEGCESTYSRVHIRTRPRIFEHQEHGDKLFGVITWRRQVRVERGSQFWYLLCDDGRKLLGHGNLVQHDCLYPRRQGQFTAQVCRQHGTHDSVSAQAQRPCLVHEARGILVKVRQHGRGWQRLRDIDRRLTKKLRWEFAAVYVIGKTRWPTLGVGKKFVQVACDLHPQGTQKVQRRRRESCIAQRQHRVEMLPRLVFLARLEQKPSTMKSHRRKGG